MLSKFVGAIEEFQKKIDTFGTYFSYLWVFDLL